MVCTTRDSHLIRDLELPLHLFKHSPTKAEPLLLGFECQTVLRDNIDNYDYYCFLEDDLILHDPWFFHKLRWFSDAFGIDTLLQPNRFEVPVRDDLLKAYIDGDIPSHLVTPFQNLADVPVLSHTFFDVHCDFVRPGNPHSGCYFLNSDQMQRWAASAHFLDRDTSFVGPLESAATLCILKTFRIYKPYRSTASFLEIEHHGSAGSANIGKVIHFAHE